jgi:hypothetical protein
MAVAVALRDMQQQVLNPIEVTVPMKPIKKPKEWTVLETTGAAVNGSYCRYTVGQKLTDPIEVTILRDAGVKIAATA